MRRLPVQSQDLAGGSESDRPEQGRELGRFPPHADVVARAMPPGHPGPRLVGVQLPGMEVEHRALPLAAVHPSDPEPGEPKRQEPEVPPAPHRQVDTSQPDRPYRELDETTFAASPDDVRKAGGAS